MKSIYLSLIVALLLSVAVPVGAASKSDDAVFQIVKASDSRVWRLNKITGEVSVCSLDGEHMVCSSSSNAVEVPKQSYEQRQASKEQNLEAEKMRREEQRKKDMAFLDRVIDAVKSLISASMERETQ